MSGEAALERFFQTLREARRAALLLDYDGTLAPFRIKREEAVPYAGVRTLLQAIREQTDTRLVVISGRALDDLLPLLALDPPPELWGCHGWERLDADGRRTLHPLAARQVEALTAAWAVIAKQQLETRCERKPASVALHWRGLPEVAARELETAISRAWQPLASGQLLELHPFDGGIELRACGRTKATAVREVLATLGDDQPVAFLGDDLTDEDGFRAIRGRGLGILVRKIFRPTAAEVHLHPPRELLEFLDQWCRYAPRRLGFREDVR